MVDRVIKCCIVILVVLSGISCVTFDKFGEIETTAK